VYELVETAIKNYPRQQAVLHQVAPSEYTIVYVEDRSYPWLPRSPTPMPLSAEEALALDAAAYHAQGRNCCVIAFRALQACLNYVGSDLINVLWLYCVPKRRLTIRVQGSPPINEHDFLVLRCREADYVFDPCARQFGVPEWFFSVDDYEATCVHHIIGQRNSSLEFEQFARLGRELLPGDYNDTIMFLKTLTDQVWFFFLNETLRRHGRLINELVQEARHRRNDNLNMANFFFRALHDAMTWPQRQLRLRQRGFLTHFQAYENLLFFAPLHTDDAIVLPHRERYDIAHRFFKATRMWVWSNEFWSRVIREESVLDGAAFDKLLLVNADDFAPRIWLQPMMGLIVGDNRLRVPVAPVMAAFEGHEQRPDGPPNPNEQWLLQQPVHIDPDQQHAPLPDVGNQLNDPQAVHGDPDNGQGGP
jgi:hypothetical protein